MNTKTDRHNSLATGLDALRHARLSRSARGRLEHAIRLSAAALAEEPDEWLAQLIARLRGEREKPLQRLLEQAAKARRGFWLKPMHAPLIAAGGPIFQIIDVRAPCGENLTLVWSRDTKTVTWYDGSSFRVWDIKAGQEVWRLELPIEHGFAAISNPPQRAIVSVQQRLLLLVNLEAASAEEIYAGRVIEAIAISADGRWAATSAVPADWDYGKFDSEGPRTLRLFDLDKKSCVRTWQAHRARIRDLVLSADGHYLATASDDRTVKLEDLQEGKTIASWRSRHGPSAIAITPDGRRIAYGAYRGGLVVREREGGVVIRSADCVAGPGCLAMSSDGRKVVAAGEVGLRLIDISASKRFGPVESPQPYLSALAVDDSACHAVTGEGGYQLVLWNLKGMKPAPASGLWTQGIWASPDKALIHQNGLSIWDLATPRKSAVLQLGSRVVDAAPSARVWAVASWTERAGGRIEIGKWGRKGTVLLFRTQHLFTDLRFSRNGARLVATLHRLGCQVWDLHDRNIVWQQDEIGLGARAFLSPSGRYLLMLGLLGDLEVLDLTTREVVRRNLPRPSMGHVLFGADDECLFVEQDGQTALFNWRTNSFRILFLGVPSSISDDGHWIVTETKRRKLTLWALQEERRAATFTLDSPVLHSALSPDGSYLVAGDQAGNVHILRRQG